MTVSGTGTFVSSGTDSYTALTQTGGMIDGSGVHTLTGAFTQSGGSVGGAVDINAATFTQSGGATVAAGSTVTASGAQTLQGGTIAGMLDGAGPVTLTSGTTTVTNAGSISNAPTIAIATGATLSVAGSLPVSTAVTLSGTGRLTIGDFVAIGSLTGGSTSTVTLTAGALTTGGNNGPTTFAGVMSGAGGFVKGGTGTFTLTGANTFNGLTEVNAGTLALRSGGNLNGVGSVSVASGATLEVRPSVTAATNNIGGALTLAGGATLSMADGVVSTLTVGGNATFGGSTAANLTFDLGSAALGVDRITVTGQAQIGSAFGVITINGVGSATPGAGPFTLISGGAGSGLAGFLLANTRVGVGGLAYPLNLSQGSTNVSLTVGAASGVDRAFWRGDVDGSWTTNNAGNTNWATDATGRTELGATPGVLTDVFFSTLGAGNLTTTVPSSDLNSITFTSGSGAVSVGSATTLRLNAGGVGAIGIEVSGGFEQRTFTSALAVLADQSWVNDGAFGVTTLSLPGGTVNSIGGRQLTIDGRGNTLINGPLRTSSITGLVKTGAGTLTLGAPANTFTSPVTINGGVVSINVNTNLGNAANGVTLNAGGTLRLGGTITLGTGRTLTVNGTAGSPSGLDLKGGITGTLGHTTALAGAGTVLVSTTGSGTAATLSIEEAQAFTGSVVVGAPGRMVGDTLSPRTFSAASGLILQLQNAGKLASASSVTVNNGSALQITQGATAVTNRIAAALTFHHGRFQYDPAGTTAISDSFGAVTATGVLTLTGGATAGPAAGTTLNFGALTRTNNATLALNVAPSGQGSIGSTPGVGVNYTFSGMTDSGGTAGTPARGIVPWAAAATLPSFPGDFTTLVTYDSNGFRPLTGSEVNQVMSQSQFDAAPSTHNVDAFLSGNLAVNGAKTINALTAQGGQPVFTGSGVLTLASGAIANLNTVTFDGAGLSLPASGGYFHLGFGVNIQGSSAITGGGSSGLTVSALNADPNHQLRLTNTVANTFTGGLFINGNAQVTFTANNQLGGSKSFSDGPITLSGGQLLFNGTFTRLGAGDPASRRVRGRLKSLLARL